MKLRRKGSQTKENMVHDIVDYSLAFGESRLIGARLECDTKISTAGILYDYELVPDNTPTTCKKCLKISGRK